jgi:hypothetical protein
VRARGVRRRMVHVASDARDVAHRHCALGGRICRPGGYSRPSHAHGKCGCGRIMG